MTRLNCCILVPVYNHPDTLPALVDELSQTGLPLLLVNDGSDAPCSAVLQALAREHNCIHLIERERNGGKGAAVKTGLRAAVAAGYSHALQIDADGQHDSRDIPALLALAEAQPEAVVTGVPRYANAPTLRYYGRYLTHIWVWIHTLSLDISDALCGFRVYPLAATVALIEEQHTGDRMDFDPEILVRLHWAGLAVLEHPTAVDYPRDGVSHFRGLQDNLLISWAHTRLFFGMLRRLPAILTQRWRRGARPTTRVGSDG